MISLFFVEHFEKSLLKSGAHLSRGAAQIQEPIAPVIKDRNGAPALGFGFGGALGLGLIASGIWGVTAWRLGQQYERRRAVQCEPGPEPTVQYSDAA